MKYNNINENNEVHMLSSLKQTFTKVTGEKSIRLNNKNSLIFNLKLKKQNNTDKNENTENEDIENYLRYDNFYYILNHYKVGEVQGREYTVMGGCTEKGLGKVPYRARWCGGRLEGHNVDMYLLQSDYIRHFKFDPFNSDKEYLEYGDEVWISYNHSSEKNQLLSCGGDGVYINFNPRTGPKTGNHWTDTTFENPTSSGFPNYSNALIKIISPLGKTGKVLKKDKFILQFRNGYYLRINTSDRTVMGSGKNTNSCGDKLFAGVRADPKQNIETQLWSIIESATKFSDNWRENTEKFDKYFNENIEDNNIELFKIKGKNETINFSIKNNNLLITEHDIKYIKNNNTYNDTLEHINHVNTICNIKKININIYNNIILDFVPINNLYSLTIHNGNKFKSYILNIDLTEILRETVLSVTNNIELKYKICVADPQIIYKSVKIAEKQDEEIIIKEEDPLIFQKYGYNWNRGMPKNYFGKKIKNNFYKSNRIDNLYVKISSETNEIKDLLNPQTILWNESYNNQESENWRCGVDCINKMGEKIKNKFLKINNTPQTVVYEFNRPINISELRFNLDEKIKNKMNFKYFDEKTNTYKNILNNIPIEDNLKNWFSTWAGSQLQNVKCLIVVLMLKIL